jgi:hypothetical protein
LLDQLSPSWASRPDRRLGDVLKIESPKRLEFLAAELRRVGIRDLDKLVTPDLPQDDG